jgi:phenylacetate-CoA ligase
MDAEALYARLPVFLQHAACSWEGWRIRRRRFDACFHALLEEYAARAQWSPEERVAYRDRRLAAFVRHAVTTTPYYRELFRSLGATPEDFRSLEDLQRLPVLRKAEVQSRVGDFISDAAAKLEARMAHTSGTTGAGLRFPVARAAEREHWAVWWRFRRLHGIALDTPCCYFGGRSVVPLRQRRPPFWRYNWPGRQWIFSGYHLGPETARDYLEAVRRSGCVWIHGYPSLVALLAGYAIEYGVRLSPRWVSLGAESVLPQQRAVIAQGFGVMPITHYSMAEGVANISQHPDGRFYVDEDFSAVEFLPRVEGGHEIVGTNFSNAAFPLLRYATGDLATLPERASAGAFGREVLQVDGRREDYVITKSGARLGRLDHIFKDMVHVREAQIRQERVGAMRLIVVRGPGYGAQDEECLRAETRKRVGDDLEFTIEYADAIPRGAGGKLRFVVSSVGEGGRAPEAGRA